MGSGNEKVDKSEYDRKQAELDHERSKQEYELRLRDEQYKREREKMEQERKFAEEMQKQRQEMLTQQITQYKEMMKKIQDDNDKRAREQEEKMRQYMEEKKKEEEEMKRKIEETKNLEEKKKLEEEARKEKEKREKEEKILNKFKSDKEEKIKEEVEKIRDKFIQNSNNFCVEEIKKYDKEKIMNLVNSFKKSEHINLVLEEKIKKLTNEYLNSKGTKTINHLNIVLVGPSGVGKSTLINSVLELDGFNCAKEGEAEPCTMGSPKYFDSKKVNFIRLGDSQGIEKGSYGIESVVKDVKNFIEAQLLTKDPDRYVHCLWYCITGARFEDVEKQSLEELARIYDNNTLPIIVVYTKAMMPNLYKPIEAKVKELKRGLEFVPVISKDIEIEEECDDDDDEENEEGEKVKKKRLVKKKGVKKLMLLSCDKAKGAVQSSCYTGIKNNIKEDVINNNKLQNEQMEQYIKQINKSKISKFKEGMDLNEMVDEISELIQYVIKEYIYCKENAYLRTESSDRIEYFLNEFFQKNLDVYQNIFGEYIEKHSDEIAQKLYEFQKDVNSKNNGIIQEDIDDYRKQVKKLLADELKSKAELFCLKNAASFISEPIRKLFSELILKLFEESLETEKTRKILEESASQLFGNLKVMLDNKTKKSKTEEKN